MPCATPPCTWPSTISGLISRPQSSATTKRSSRTSIGLRIDLDRRDVGRRRGGAEHRIVGLGRGKLVARLGGSRAHLGIDRARDLAERHRTVGAGDRDRAVLGDKIGGRCFEQMRGRIEHLLAHRLRRQASRRRQPAPVLRLA